LCELVGGQAQLVFNKGFANHQDTIALSRNTKELTQKKLNREGTKPLSRTRRAQKRLIIGKPS
jgi:hypothetical protein